MPKFSAHLAFTFLTALVACQACSRSGNSSGGIIVVNSPAAGEISRVLAREGMEVSEGQPIAEIAVYSTAQSASPTAADGIQARAGVSVQAAQAEVEAARTEVVRHEVEVQRLTSLVSSGQAPQGNLDAERALYERAQQRLQRAKTAVQQAQSGLVAARQQSLNSSIATASPAEQIVAARASAAGTVSALNMWVGERVVAGQPLATIRAH
jgi:multidrug efflux pump subunit AcrA (membrane-fusion protein)